MCSSLSDDLESALQKMHLMPCNRRQWLLSDKPRRHYAADQFMGHHAGSHLRVTLAHLRKMMTILIYQANSDCASIERLSNCFGIARLRISVLNAAHAEREQRDILPRSHRQGAG